VIDSRYVEMVEEIVRIENDHLPNFQGAMN